MASWLVPSMACTNLIVGKKASKDGSVMCSYNCDGFGFSGSLFYSPSGRHEKGEKIAIHGWGPTHEGQFVEQVDFTRFIENPRVDGLYFDFDEIKAEEAGAASVCVPPSYVEEAKSLVSKVKVCTVIGFPNGYNSLKG